MNQQSEVLALRDTLARIAITDTRRCFEALREETRKAAIDVLASGQYLLGEQVSAFEREAAAYLNVPHVLGVGSGTEALLLALQDLEVGPGDEVITTAFTFVASGTSIARLGARPVFVDVDPVTLQMDPGAVAEAISPRTRAIVAVHLYGFPAPMDALLRLAFEPDDPTPVIEDAAQAIGSTCHVSASTCRLAGIHPVGGDIPPEGLYGKAGTFGTWGCYSFYPTKNLPACGDAGMMCTSQSWRAERGRKLRVHGQNEQYVHELLGNNGRIDALQAAILRVRLPHLDAWNQRRRDHAALMDRLFVESGLLDRVEGLQLPARPPPGEQTNYHQYTLRVPGRDALQSYLAEKGIASGVYYPLPLPFQPIFKELGYGPGSFPNAEAAAAEVLSLPVHPFLEPGDVERIVGTIADYYRR